MYDDAQPVILGVEEEFHVVDLHTRCLVPRAPALLERLPSDRFDVELQKSVVETNSHPCARLDELHDDLIKLRLDLVAAAEPLGLGIAAAGTVPVAAPSALGITPSWRYERMLAEYQIVAREQLICGAQVHVNVQDRDMAVLVMQRVAPWLPVLLALSASSPYWFGSDSGYASYRTVVWQRWPTAGPAGSFANAREYDQVIGDLIRSGVISDEGMVYYDIRPSAHLPTLELRICDACPRVEDVVMLAGLFRALVLHARRAIETGEPTRPLRVEVLRALTWRAARSGLESELVNPVSLREVPARRLIERLIYELRDSLDATGDWELVAGMVSAVLTRESAATRQRNAYDRRGELRDVIDLILEETRTPLSHVTSDDRRRNLRDPSMIGETDGGS